MALKTQTKTGSTERVLRTIFQILVASTVAIPALTSVLGLSPHMSEQVVGITGLIVVLVTALHNGLETAGLLPAMLKDVPLPAMTSQLTVAAATVSPTLVADAAKIQAAAPIVAPVVQAAEVQAITPVSGA